jgi:hypothetical protein
MLSQIALSSAGAAKFRTPKGLCVPFGNLERALEAADQGSGKKMADRALQLLLEMEEAPMEQLDDLCRQMQVGRDTWRVEWFPGVEGWDSAAQLDPMIGRCVLRWWEERSPEVWELAGARCLEGERTINRQCFGQARQAMRRIETAP